MAAVISSETVRAVQKVLINEAIGADALLGGFSAVNAMHVPGARGNLPFLKVIALHAPRGAVLEQFVRELVTRANSVDFIESGEKVIAKPPVRSAYWCLRIVSSRSDVPLREVATVAPFPDLPFLPADIALDEITWNLQVQVGGETWNPRALLPSVFRQVLIASNSSHVFDTFNAFESEGVLLPFPTEKEDALAPKWIEVEPEAPATTAAISTTAPRVILRRVLNRDAVPDASAGAVVFPTAASTPASAFAPPVDTEAFYASLRGVSSMAWTAAEKLAELLIEYPTLPRIQFTAPEINITALAELHAAAHASHTAHLHVPGSRAIDAYLYASNALPHGRYGMWALLNVLFAIPLSGRK